MLVARLKDDDHPLTESAQISVFQKNEIIFEIEAVWQIGGPGDEN